MLYDGLNGSVELWDTCIVIRRKGFANILTQGLQGEKTVPIDRVTAVQFRPAGAVVAGLIQFTIQGGREFHGGMLEATKDENAVTFAREQNATFAELRDLVQQAMLEPQHAPGQPRSAVDDLTQLAALFDRGLLTREEFDERKRAVLSERPPLSTRIRTDKARVGPSGPFKAVALDLEPNSRGRRGLLPWWGWLLALILILWVVPRIVEAAW